jgi:hypothetical protein
VLSSATSNHICPYETITLGIYNCPNKLWPNYVENINVIVWPNDRTKTDNNEGLY